MALPPAMGPDTLHLGLEGPPPRGGPSPRTSSGKEPLLSLLSPPNHPAESNFVPEPPSRMPRKLALTTPCTSITPRTCCCSGKRGHGLTLDPFSLRMAQLQTPEALTLSSLGLPSPSLHAQVGRGQGKTPKALSTVSHLSPSP